MSVNPERLRQSGRRLADAGDLLQWAAHAVHPASSVLGRVTAAASVLRLGSRLLPAGERLLRRHPVGSLLVVAGLLGALYLARSPRTPARAPVRALGGSLQRRLG